MKDNKENRRALQDIGYKTTLGFSDDVIKYKTIGQSMQGGAACTLLISAEQGFLTPITIHGLAFIGIETIEDLQTLENFITG